MSCEKNVQQPDEELAALAAGGDARAFEEIYRRHRGRVYAVALRMTGNHAEAEDLAQESFLALLQKIGSFRGRSAFTTWLCRLAINQVKMHFRRRRSRPEDLTSDGEMPERKANGAAAFGSPAALDRVAIERAVGELPAGFRTAFILYDVEGFEHEEIARMTGRTPGTSKSQLHKARARLRELLSPPSPLLQS